MGQRQLGTENPFAVVLGAVLWRAGGCMRGDLIIQEKWVHEAVTYLSEDCHEAPIDRASVGR
jgi:hypothetical protein